MNFKISRAVVTLALVGLIFSALARASVRMDLVYRKDGQTMPITVVTKLGHTAFVSEIDEHSKNGFEILATPRLKKNSDKSQRQAIEMSFEVSEIKNNKRTFTSKPTIVALVGDNATLSESRSTGVSYELSARASFQ